MPFLVCSCCSLLASVSLSVSSLTPPTPSRTQPTVMSVLWMEVGEEGGGGGAHAALGKSTCCPCRILPSPCTSCSRTGGHKRRAPPVFCVLRLGATVWSMDMNQLLVCVVLCSSLALSYGGDRGAQGKVAGEAPIKFSGVFHFPVRFAVAHVAVMKNLLVMEVHVTASSLFFPFLFACPTWVSLGCRLHRPCHYPPPLVPFSSPCRAEHDLRKTTNASIKQTGSLQEEVCGAVDLE